MAGVSQSQLKRLTAVHGWSGILLGLLLYAVIVTGTAVVFGPEIAAWSIGGQRTGATLSGPIDAPVSAAYETVTKGYREEISVYADARGDLLVFPHAHMHNRQTGELSDYGTLFRVDPESGAVIARRDGFLWENPDWYDNSALRHFLVELHVQLSVPEPWGLLLTGILGLLTMSAAVTGVIMHRHLIRDLFVAERPGKRLVSFRDRHVLAATWGLPFAFVLGFTGAYFSFAGTVLFPVLSQVAFGGDQHAMAETLFEAPVPANATPAPRASLEAIVADAEARYPEPANFLSIQRWGRADSRIYLWQEPAQGALAWRQSVYDGVDGRFIGVREPVGNAPSAAGALYGLMGPLHFGDFAGALSKAVWVGLGAAMAFVVISGLRLWVKRREEQPLWQRFGRVVTVVAWGLPLAMLASAYAFFISAAGADPFWWTPAGFIIAALACIALGIAIPEEVRAARLYRRLAGIGCLALPVLRMAMGGTGWFSALYQGAGTVLALDLLLLAGGALLLRWPLRLGAVRAPLPAPVSQPAE